MTSADEELALHFATARRRGTPTRWGRGVVQSSNAGQSSILPDGGTVAIDAFNLGHVQNLAPGTVVEVLYHGKQAFVMGAYAPPVGALVYSAVGPPSAVELTGTGGVETTTAWQFGFPAVNGQTYLMALRGQVATGGSGTAVFVNTTLASVSGGTATGAYLLSANSFAANAVLAPAGGTFSVVATATGLCVVTLQGQLDGPSTFTCTWESNAWEVNVVRVA